MDIGHSHHATSNGVSTAQVDVAPDTDSPSTTASLTGIPRAVVLGSTDEAVRTFTLRDGLVWTRNRTVRVSVWLFAWHTLTVASGAGFGALVEAAGRHLAGTM